MCETAHPASAQYSRHARESGHPVRREAATARKRLGILDHPPSRMRTVEVMVNGKF
jgi:hypothetical protein